MARLQVLRREPPIECPRRFLPVRCRQPGGSPVCEPITNGAGRVTNRCARVQAFASGLELVPHILASAAVDGVSLRRAGLIDVADRAAYPSTLPSRIRL